MASTDAEEQDQELESLKAIYGDDLDVFAAERVVEVGEERTAAASPRCAGRRPPPSGPPSAQPSTSCVASTLRPTTRMPA